MDNPMLNRTPVEQKPVPKHPKSQDRLSAQIWKHRKEYLAISPFYILFAIFGLFPIAFDVPVLSEMGRHRGDDL